MLATPVSFGLTQNPLGAVLLPQALIPRRTHSVTGGPFENIGGLTLAGLRRFERAAFFLAEPNAKG